jgi:hypothetical protein
MDAAKDIPLLDPAVVARMRRASRVAAVLAGSIGVLALLSYPLGMPLLRSLGMRGIEIQPNTGAALFAAAAGLLLAGLPARWARIGSRLIGAAVAALGAATLVEHRAGVDLGIDGILVSGLPLSEAVASPGRPGPPASLSFVLAGAVLLGLDARRAAAHVAQGLAVAAMAIALLGLVGHAYGSAPLYGRPTMTAIAFPTALALLALEIGLLCARPDRGFVANLAATGAGSALARRLLISVPQLPLFLGGIVLGVTGPSTARERSPSRSSWSRSRSCSSCSCSGTRSRSIGWRWRSSARRPSAPPRARSSLARCTASRRPARTRSPRAGRRTSSSRCSRTSCARR